MDGAGGGEAGEEGGEEVRHLDGMMSGYFRLIGGES